MSARDQSSRRRHSTRHSSRRRREKNKTHHLTQEDIDFLKKNTRQDSDINITFIIKTKTYKNIKILENNDIVINLNKETLIINSIINVHVCDKKVFEIKITDKIIQDKYLILLNKGIPRSCETNIYDISVLSHVIILFT